MKDEPTLTDYLKIIKKNRKKIIYVTSLVVLITLAISLIWPKTYESHSMIELAKIGSVSNYGVIEYPTIVEANEAEKIIRSSAVLEPVIKKFFPEEDITLKEFNEDYLEIEIFEQRISWNLIGFEPYLAIKTNANNAEDSKDINEDIIDKFISYVQPIYKRRTNVLTKQLNISKKETKAIKKEISELMKEINSLDDNKLSTEGISKSTLLRSILSEHQESLIERGDKELQIEMQLAGKRDFKVISEPKVPSRYSSPIIIINLLISLFAGLFISLSLVLIQESMKHD